MLKSLKSIMSSNNDQFSNVIHKTTQSCYQQHHYYHNGLIYTCSITSKNNRPSKIRNRNRKCNRTISKEKRRTTNEYRNNSENCINLFDSIQNYYNNSTTKTSTNSLSKVCICAYKCRVNFKVFHQLNNYRKDICVYFGEKLINLELMLVLILLALISCTAQNIDTQQKPITSQTFIVTAFNHAALVTTISFNNHIHTIYCHHRTPSILNLRAETENNFKLQTKISHNVRHCRDRYYFKDDPTHMQIIAPKFCLKWLTRNNNSNTLKNLNATKTKYQRKNNMYSDDDDNYHKDFKYNNESSIVISKTQLNNKNDTNMVVIKIKNKNMKQDELKHQAEIQNSNLFFFKKNYNIKNATYETIKNYQKFSNNFKNIENNINDHADDHFQMKNFQTKLNSLSSMTRPLQFVNIQQHIDRKELIKFVLDGLGLQKVPNMENVNISQAEYVTKYREYLQRVRLRKRRDLRETEENFLRPLEILSIVTKRTFLHQKRVLKRQKRAAFAIVSENLNYNHGNHENDKPRSLEERVKSILFLKKKNQKPRSAKKEKDARRSNIRLMFALKPEILNLKPSDVEEANIRLVLIHSPTLAIKYSKNRKFHTKPKNSSCGLSKSEDIKGFHKQNVLNFKLFFLDSRRKRVLLDERKIDIKVDHNKPEETHTQWLQFDVAKAVKTSIDEKRLKHIALELQCDDCKRSGARILNEAYNTADDTLSHDNSTEDHQLMPVLNIIGHFDQFQRSFRTHQYDSQRDKTNEGSTNHRRYHHQTCNNNKNNSHNRRNCYKPNQRCCRHSMEVIFKEIKGFEFIIQPKVFDAGYCHGRCPPRYNPAHHHALLQSLIWKQNHHKAPRPCCAPSKLIELEVLHVDEKDSNKLKISTWSDMKVVECACS